MTHDTAWRSSGVLTRPGEERVEARLEFAPKSEEASEPSSIGASIGMRFFPKSRILSLRGPTTQIWDTSQRVITEADVPNWGPGPRTGPVPRGPWG